MNEDQRHFHRSTKVQKPPPSVVIGNFKVMYRPGEAFERTQSKLQKQGFVMHYTPHFLFASVPPAERVTLVHRLPQEEIDNNIVQYLMQELAPHGLMRTDTDFASALIAVITSINPTNPAQAWGVFSINTLQRLRERLNNPSTCSESKDDNITSFASIYARLFSHKVGNSLLDVGCACAFWPLLVAEQEMEHERIVGVDNRSDAITLSKNMVTT